MNNMKYVSMHIHSQLSNNILTDSASSTKDYITVAKEKGLHGIIITEHGATLGWYKKKKEIEEGGFKYVHAFEGYTRANEDDKNNYHILVYGLNNEGRKEINQLISNAYKDNHFYKRPTFFIDELFECKNVAVSTACLATALRKNNKDSYVFQRLLEWGLQNKDRFFLEIQPHNMPEQIEHNNFIIELSREYGFKIVATNDVHYHNKISGELRKEKQKAEKMPFSYEDGLDLELKSYSEMYTALLNIGISPEIAKEALENTNIIYDMAEEYTIEKGFKMPNIYKDATKKMSEICIKKFNEKKLSVYSNQCVDEIAKKIVQEIQIIHNLKSSSYMLMIADWVNGLREHGIYPGFGRGSVNGSIVAYLMGITEIDPIKFGTLFFRFMNPEKISLPDVDTDIESDRRQEAKEWFYGRDGLNCSEIITFGKDLEKGAIRSMGRSYGMEISEVEKILANISEYRDDEEYADFFAKVDDLDGFIKSIGIHAGGMLVSDLDIEKEIGIITSFDKQLNRRRRVTQLDMREVDELGYVKVDALGLANIGAINRVCEYLGIKRPSPDDIDFEDMNVWNHILNSKHGTMIFQFEKDQAFNHLKRALKNNDKMKKLDIATAVSGVIRPCGDSIREGLFSGKINDTGSDIVNKRFAYNNGYLIYQEDIMNFLTEFSGYSNAESDYARKTISKKGGTEKLVVELRERFPKYFMEHYGETQENTDKVLNHVARIMRDAENYAFNIAHARPYTITGFLCAYFRCYYPKEFITASLNTFKNKREKIKSIYTYIKEETDIVIESPVFGNFSQEYSYDKDKNIIYEGLSGLKGVSKNADNALKCIPNDIGTFLDLLIFVKENKLSLSQKDLSILIKIDFFRNFGKQKYLLNIIEIFFNDKSCKYSEKVTQKTKDKKISLIKEQINILNPEDDFEYVEKMKNELMICGRTSKKMDWLDFDALFVLSLEHPFPSQYFLKGFNMRNGEIETYKIKREDILEGLDDNDIIVVNDKITKERKQLVDGKWQGGTGIFDTYIKSMSKVEF